MKAAPKGYDFKYGRGGDDEEHRRHEADYHLLLERHAALQRRTERLPDGIRTWTTTQDPRLLLALQRHAQDMKSRFGHDRAIRSWDPLFQKLFEYRSQVQVTLRPLADGIYAELRSQNPEVVPYLYAHGDTLAAWVHGGLGAAREPSPLPQD